MSPFCAIKDHFAGSTQADHPSSRRARCKSRRCDSPHRQRHKPSRHPTRPAKQSSGRRSPHSCAPCRPRAPVSSPRTVAPCAPCAPVAPASHPCSLHAVSRALRTSRAVSPFCAISGSLRRSRTQADHRRRAERDVRAAVATHHIVSDISRRDIPRAQPKQAAGHPQIPCAPSSPPAHPSHPNRRPRTRRTLLAPLRAKSRPCEPVAPVSPFCAIKSHFAGLGRGRHHPSSRRARCKSRRCDSPHRQRHGKLSRHPPRAQPKTKLRPCPGTTILFHLAIRAVRPIVPSVCPGRQQPLVLIGAISTVGTVEPLAPSAPLALSAPASPTLRSRGTGVLWPRGGPSRPGGRRGPCVRGHRRAPVLSGVECVVRALDGGASRACWRSSRGRSASVAVLSSSEQPSEARGSRGGRSKEQRGSNRKKRPAGVSARGCQAEWLPPPNVRLSDRRGSWTPFQL